MALIHQLQTVPSNLERLSNKLRNDPDVRYELQQTITQGDLVAVKCSEAINVQGGEILRQQSLLMSTDLPQDIKLTKLQTALTEARQCFIDVRQDVFMLQTLVHANIEMCRGRKRKHDADITIKQNNLSAIAIQTKCFEADIKVFEKDSAELKTGATELDKRARDLAEQANKKRERAKDIGIGSLIGGIVLAPFTFGTSLIAAGAIAGATVPADLNDADSCTNNARELRGSAESKRGEAASLKQQTSELKRTKRNLKNQIRPLEVERDRMKEASKTLDKLTTLLPSVVGELNRVIGVLQDLDVVTKEAEIQGESFKIIQGALSGVVTSKLDAAAHKYMEKLKVKWSSLEQVLLGYDARQ